MKCLVISPKSGKVRISRFVAKHIEEGALHPEAEARREKDGPDQFCDLDIRMKTRLRLSPALQARLYSAVAGRPLQLRRDN